jgi:hypothetical protein
MIIVELSIALIAWRDSEDGWRLLRLGAIAIFEAAIILLIVTTDLPEYQLVGCILILQFIEIRILQAHSERYLKIWGRVKQWSTKQYLFLKAFFFEFL